MLSEAYQCVATLQPGSRLIAAALLRSLLCLALLRKSVNELQG